jgi:phosphatidylserine decarboxylase
VRILTQNLLPHKLVSLLAHLSANCKIVWVKNFLISYFIKRYAVNMSEAVEPNPLAYPSYNAFFTRELKKEVRPIDLAPDIIVSPADGLLAQVGNIQTKVMIQAKGRSYSVQDLLGGSAALAAPFVDGTFATIYLAPKDYHRVHMPFTGTLETMLYIPGKLFSVNTHAAENIPNLFARNERVVSIFDTELGKMAVILVGAMIVGSIETVWAGAISPPHFKNINSWEYTEEGVPTITIEKGLEMGRFKLGSTVIVLFEPGAMLWDQGMAINMDLKIGQKIGCTT